MLPKNKHEDPNNPKENKDLNIVTCALFIAPYPILDFVNVFTHSEEINRKHKGYLWTSDGGLTWECDDPKQRK